MTKLQIQSLFAPGKMPHYASGEAPSVVTDGNSIILANAAHRLRAWLADVDHKRRREHENARAIAHLRSLSDGQLRDIGIARTDIERAVHRGRENV
jgi:uncharacterized protein YjiS (DUF1127 family)